MALDFLRLRAKAGMVGGIALGPQAAAPFLGFAFEALAAEAVEIASRAPC